MGSLHKMKLIIGLIFILISLAKAQNPVASAHCNFDEESFVSIVQKDNGVTDIMGFVYGLGPNPVHGFHIHEFGDLSDGCQSCEAILIPTTCHMVPLVIMKNMLEILVTSMLILTG